MTALYHTNGTATIYIGQGTGGSVLGLSSSEGVRIEITTAIEPVYSDERGPSVPSENLINGSLAALDFELWKFDTTVLNALMALREGGTQGQMNTIGTLQFYNSLTTGITVSSPNDGQNWYFPRAWISEEPMGVQLSTQLKIWRMKLAAAPGLFSNGGTVLYQFV